MAARTGGAVRGHESVSDVCDDRRRMTGTATDWFLTAEQRGNPASRIDAGRGSRAWTTGNAAEVLIDGVEYFAALRRALASAPPPGVKATINRIVLPL